MKTLTKIKLSIVTCQLLIVCCCLPASNSYAQDTTHADKGAPIARAKNTFGGNLIIDNQTVMVAVKNTFEFAIQHRFGVINNGYSDFYGIFAPANIRLGLSYTIIDNLQLGLGLTKERMLVDGNIKYALSKQAVSGGCPISVTYYGDMAISTLPKKGNFVSDVDRYSYFNQLIIARKVTDKFSVQVSPSISYFNNIEGYMSKEGTIKPRMNNMHYAIAFMGRYKLTDGMGVIVNYDQPLTQHPSSNPHPNVSFGIDLGTTGHSFQIFVGNYQSINQQANNFFNQNDFTTSRYCIGFNITRKWYDFLGKK